MTVAVCFKCGAMKTGAWTPCDACRVMPRTENDLVLSMALSDNHPQMDLQALQRLGEHIHSGKPFDVDAKSRANILQMIRSLPSAQKQLARQMGITAFEDSPLKMEGKMKEKFTDSEWMDIRKFPLFIMCFVAAADNKIDFKELRMIIGFFQNKDACSAPLLRECLIDTHDEVDDCCKQQRSSNLSDSESYIHRCVEVLKKNLSPSDYDEFTMNVFVMGARVANMTKSSFFDKSKIGDEELAVLNSLASLFEIEQEYVEAILEMVKNG